MRSLLVTGSMFLALAATACDNKSSAPQATVTSATPAAASAAPAAASATPNAQGATAPAAGAAKYAISSDTSKIEWTGAKITGKHEGAFKKFSGTIKERCEDAPVTTALETVGAYRAFE